VVFSQKKKKATDVTKIKHSESFLQLQLVVSEEAKRSPFVCTNNKHIRVVFIPSCLLKFVIVQVNHDVYMSFSGWLSAMLTASVWANSTTTETR
jgi:hypothetical protein